ncbi:MAG: hypothetical protein QOG49_636, partial [Frankiaceae bacterium]|nr:hypothetical protein [Frankiaceae bacterium]
MLLDLTTITVDPAYVEAAGRRAARGYDAPDRHQGLIAAALLAVIGLLGAIAFAHTQRSAPQAARVRQALTSRVDRLTQQTDAQGTALEALRSQVGAERDRALAASSADAGLADLVRATEFAAGAARVTGPGVVVVLGDAPSTQTETPTRVQDRDVQRAVNIAWSTGAEAVGVNGQRVGPLTAIRQAGDSILVDYRPVTSPFRIEVICDSAAIERAFTVSAASGSLRAIARTMQFRY